MEDVTIIRIANSDQGTEGILIYEDFRCFTLELPNRGNKKNLSCIPLGDYDTTIRISPRFGRVYWIIKVKDRAYILIHSGNWAGDVEKGFKTHTEGCILLGEKQGYLLGQRAVLLSRKALRQFMTKLNGYDFKLHIISAQEK